MIWKTRARQRAYQEPVSASLKRAPDAAESRFDELNHRKAAEHPAAFFCHGRAG
jgi:hypothetical protein